MMKEHSLGKLYKDGETIIRQGETGDCMFVIQSGMVLVITQKDGGKEIPIAELGEGEFFGEMALFEKEVRSATVRAQGDVYVLTVDKKTLLSRIQQDPSMAFHILEKMSSRIRELDAKFTHITSNDRRNWHTRPEIWA
jgi:CRP-like cAMP-binding protein